MTDNNSFNLWSKSSSEPTLDKDDVLQTILTTLILIMVTIVIPLAIYITEIIRTANMVTILNNYDTNPVIERMYNKQMYGRIRNV